MDNLLVKQSVATLRATSPQNVKTQNFVSW